MDRLAEFGIWLGLLTGLAPVLWAIIEWVGSRWPKIPKKYAVLVLGLFGGVVMYAAGWLPHAEGEQAWAGWILAALGGLGSAILASKGIHDGIIKKLKGAKP
jgi:hypothetical protein